MLISLSVGRVRVSRSVEDLIEEIVVNNPVFINAMCDIVVTSAVFIFIGDVGFTAVSPRTFVDKLLLSSGFLL